MTSKEQGGNLGPRETASPRARSVLTCAIAGSQEPAVRSWRRFILEL